jgi:hypothetical protein
VTPPIDVGKLAQEIAAALHQRFWVNQHASSTPATVEEIAEVVLPLLVPRETRGISLGKDWPATKDRLIREIRASEKLTGAEMAQRIGVAEMPREPELCGCPIPSGGTCQRVFRHSGQHAKYVFPPAPLTRAEEAQPWVYVGKDSEGRCLRCSTRGCDGMHAPEPPPEAQSEEPKP